MSFPASTGFPASTTFPQELTGAAVRQLGIPIVTIAWVARPVGLEHTRMVEILVIRGRLLVIPDGQVKDRAQGVPQVSAHIALMSLDHGPQLGAPEINVRVLEAPSLSRA